MNFKFLDLVIENNKFSPKYWLIGCKNSNNIVVMIQGKMFWMNIKRIWWKLTLEHKILKDKDYFSITTKAQNTSRLLFVSSLCICEIFVKETRDTLYMMQVVMYGWIVWYICVCPSCLQVCWRWTRSVVSPCRSCCVMNGWKAPMPKCSPPCH